MSLPILVPDVFQEMRLHWQCTYRHGNSETLQLQTLAYSLIMGAPMTLSDRLAAQGMGMLTIYVTLFHDSLLSHELYMTCRGPLHLDIRSIFHDMLIFYESRCPSLPALGN
jgi:hypothetical protein